MDKNKETRKRKKVQKVSSMYIGLAYNITVCFNVNNGAIGNKGRGNHC